MIPTYNRADLLPRAVQSVLAQCAPEDEIIIVDDGSTDHTQRVAAQFSRVVYFPVSHGGAGRARNCGVRAAKHSLIAFLDSDDEWIAGTLELKRTLIQAKPDIVFCFSDLADIDKAGRLHHGALAQWREDHRPWDDILGPGVQLSELAPLPPGVQDCLVHIGNLYLAEMTASYISSITIVVRRELAGEALHFAEDLPTYEDWECFGRLTRKGNSAYLACETAIQHGHSGSRLTDANLLQRATARITLLQRVWGADPKFLAEYGRSYHELLLAQRLMRVRQLLRTGDTRTARQEIRGRERSYPASCRLLAQCPGWLASGVIRGRSWAKLLLRRRAGEAEQDN